jgi:hypothetical protein
LQPHFRQWLDIFISDWLYIFLPNITELHLFHFFLLPPLLGVSSTTFPAIVHPMAQFVKLSRDGKPISRQRPGHVRRTISLARLREYSFQRLLIEWERYCSSSCSPLPRQMQPLPQRPLPAPRTPSYSWVSPFDTTFQYSGYVRMERTPSGTPIISDKSFEPRHNHTFTCCDKEAARKVEIHFHRLAPYNPEKGLLWSLILRLIKNPSRVVDLALDQIMNLSDLVFFGGALSGRVRWEWSDPSQERFETELIGMTALRPAAQGGYETLIVLSSPILTHPDYDRRLLLSAFLHELVHCYLFIQCGFKARLNDGHTDGFHRIVSIIDRWAGSGFLRLCDMKANLDHFLSNRERCMQVKCEGLRYHHHDGCNQSPGPQKMYLEHVGVNLSWA